MNDWQKEVEALFKKGMKISEITEQVEKKLGYDGLYDRIQKYIKRHLNSTHPYPKEEKQPVNEKPVIIQNQIPEQFNPVWGGCKSIVFGLMGDTQFGSKYAQLTYLHRFYDLCAAQGICNVYHTGDITDGLKMRPGHEYDLYEVSADEMLKDVVKNYPNIEGIKTHFITGNHDAAIFKQCGYDIGYAIEKERPDLHYLGRDCAMVNLTPKCTLELRHPWDGTAYAISYKIQKMIEAMEADSKPNILAVGHYHKAEYIFYRNVHCFQTGCFQGTPFTRGKGISIHMGGWIIEIRVDDNGFIQAIKPEFIPFYTSIKDDYKKWIGGERNAETGRNNCIDSG